jgi:hypothetical protein
MVYLYTDQSMGSVKTAVIREEDGKFCVRSPNNPDWNGGCYDTKGEAEKRLAEVEYFKSKGAAHRVACRWAERSAVALPEESRRTEQYQEPNTSSPGLEAVPRGRVPEEKPKTVS